MSRTSQKFAVFMSAHFFPAFLYDATQYITSHLSCYQNQRKVLYHYSFRFVHPFLRYLQIDQSCRLCYICHNCRRIQAIELKKFQLTYDFHEHAAILFIGSNRNC